MTFYTSNHFYGPYALFFGLGLKKKNKWRLKGKDVL